MLDQKRYFVQCAMVHIKKKKMLLLLVLMVVNPFFIHCITIL